MQTIRRREFLGISAGFGMAGLVSALAGCGGGGEGTPIEGSRELKQFTARDANGASTGTQYPLNIYYPPASAGPRAKLPVIYVLDGDSWFETLVEFAESTRTRLIVVAISNAGQRSRDFVPVNTCSLGGGGHAAFYDVLRNQLMPFVQANVGGDASQSILFGHSHGASFALFAVFSEAPGKHPFKTYLACDSSVACMPSTAYGWEANYANAYNEIPVRLHLSYASLGNAAANIAYGAKIEERKYGKLQFSRNAYNGTHSGVVPQALAEGIVFALSN